MLSLLSKMAGQPRRQLLLLTSATVSGGGGLRVCGPDGRRLLAGLASASMQARLPQSTRPAATFPTLSTLPTRQPARWGGHGGPRKMVIQPSRNQWDHFWDDVHFYALLGIIPCSLLALYLYIFVGPAELTELPEDYEPQEYEYHRHPLTRFFAWFKTHCVVSEQEAYERDIAYQNEEFVRAETRKEFEQIKQQEAMLGDYRGYYFVPVNPRPVSQHHAHRQIEDMAGDVTHGFQSEDPRELPTDIGAPRHQY